MRTAQWRRGIATLAIASMLAGSVPAEAVQEAGAASAPPAAEAGEADPALYKPVDADERGLWMQMDELERDMRTSPNVIRDPALNAYVRGVLCKLTGPARCANVRIYITRTPQFNASMAPNGMMQVWSGLLLRTQNEAQLAAVLGHEYTHFEHQHTLQLFRQIKAKTDAASWISFIPFGFIASLGMISSIFSFSREQERDADSGGLALMANAGYDTREAAVVWERLRSEMDATAAERKTKSRKDKNGGLFATHPPTAERVASLRAEAEKKPGVPGEVGADRYRAALAGFWPDFIDDQMKLNDFGASEFLLASLAGENWDPSLLYARGELYRRRAATGDLELAVGFYGQGMAAGGTIPALWRGRGLALQKLGRAAEGKADLAEYLRRAPEAADKSMIQMLVGGM